MIFPSHVHPCRHKWEAVEKLNLSRAESFIGKYNREEQGAQETTQFNLGEKENNDLVGRKSVMNTWIEGPLSLKKCFS